MLCCVVIVASGRPRAMMFCNLLRRNRFGSSCYHCYLSLSARCLIVLTSYEIKFSVQRCQQKYKRAEIEPGTAVGALGAQSIGEPVRVCACVFARSFRNVFCFHSLENDSAKCGFLSPSFLRRFGFCSVISGVCLVLCLSLFSFFALFERCLVPALLRCYLGLVFCVVP